MFDFTNYNIEQLEGCDVWVDVFAVDMGNNFKLYVWYENNKIIEVEISYKDTYVGTELTFEVAEHYVNSITPESLASLEQELFENTKPHPIVWN